MTVLALFYIALAWVLYVFALSTVFAPADPVVRAVQVVLFPIVGGVLGWLSLAFLFL